MKQIFWARLLLTAPRDRHLAGSRRAVFERCIVASNYLCCPRARLHELLILFITSLFSRLDNIASCIDTWRLAKLTEGFSGSDLRELCRHAAVCRVYELAPEDCTLRPITMDDLLASLAKMKESKIECGELDLRTPNLD
jgi:hypothetical protein